MALTAEQEQEQKALLAAVKIQVNQVMEEKLNKLPELVEGYTGFKELKDICTRLNAAKTAEEVTTVKDQIKTFEDSILELKGRIESDKKKAANVAITKHNMLGAIGGAFGAGMADLHAKGIVDKFIRKEIKQLSIFSSDTRVDESGNKTKMTPTIGMGAKVDNPMSDATSVVPIGTGVAFSLTQFEPGLTRVSRRKPFITQLVDLARTMTAIVAWVEQTNIDTGTAFSIAEGAAGSGTYGSFRWTENSSPVQRIQAMSKITNEMLADVSNAQNEVQTEIMELLALKLDSQVLKGTGNAPQLKGILQYAQAFSNAGNLAVAAPNNYDAIVAAILQVKINGVASGLAGGGEIINIFEPNEIVMHPADIASMKLTKDTLTRYILDQSTYPVDNMGQEAIAGLRVTENIGMTQGSLLVMDANKSHARIREDAEVTLGYNSTDFQDNMVSVKGLLRAGHYIKSNQVNAFVSDTFNNIKTSIQAV